VAQPDWVITKLSPSSYLWSSHALGYIWLLQGCCYQGIETVNRLGQPCYMLVQPYSYNVAYAQYKILLVGM